MDARVEWQTASWQNQGMPLDKMWYSREVDAASLNYGMDAHWSGRRGFEPPHLEDQSTDEGSSTCTIDIGSEVAKSPDSDTSRRSRRRAEDRQAGWLDLQSEGAFHDPHLGFPVHNGSHPALESAMAWAAEGIHASSICEGETPFLATVSATSGSPVLTHGFAGQMLGAMPSNLEAHDAYNLAASAAYQPSPLLRTSPWGGQGGAQFSANLAFPAPAAVISPEALQPWRLPSCQDDPSAWPRDTPLKVNMRKFECEVFPLDPRFPAKKRPPNW